MVYPALLTARRMALAYRGLNVDPDEATRNKKWVETRVAFSNAPELPSEHA